MPVYGGRSRRTGPHAVPEYDVIIVGAGTAGCLLARRVVERSGHSVLLIEAGPRYPAPLLDPPLAGLRLRGPWTDPLRTTPQHQLTGQRLECPVGRVVGGSSSINAMMHVPGSPDVFDAWAAAGCDGWSARDLAPCFTAAIGPAAPLRVAPPRSLAPFTRAFLEACSEDGLEAVPWLAGDRAGVCGPFAQFQHRGRRVGAARDVLGTLPKRGRVTLRTRATVRRVTIAGHRATGVELADGTTIAARAGVVLAAGVYRSPVLLQRSGIGPRDLLVAAGIEPLLDRPAVGENLQDHPRVPVLFRSARRSPGHWSRWPAAALRYLVFRDGIILSNCCEAGALLAIDRSRATPDVEIITHFQTAWAPGAVDLECVLLTTTSRGRVRIDPRDPWGPPVIDPRYLSDEGEIATLSTAVERARSIAARPALVRFGIGPETLPGKRSDVGESIRRTVSTAHHPAGTCRMGDDAEAVVDSRLRVRGIEDLHVVDASIMPLLPAGHPSATVYAIAEMAATFLAGD